MYYNLRPKVFNPILILGTIFGIGIFIFTLLPVYESEESSGIFILIVLFSIVFLIASYLNKYNTRLFAKEDYVGYKTLFQNKKIQLKDIKSITQSKHGKRGEKVIEIKPNIEDAKNDFFAGTAWSKSIYIGNDFDKKEVAKLLKFLRSRNNKFETDDHVEVIIINKID